MAENDFATNPGTNCDKKEEIGKDPLRFLPDVGEIIEENPGIPGNEVEKQGEKIVCRKNYKYHSCYLRWGGSDPNSLLVKREKLLRDCAAYCGLDGSRIDTHDSEVVWQILEFMLPVLQMRNQARDMARKIGLKPEDLR
jgi:hypothetical protein